MRAPNLKIAFNLILTAFVNENDKIPASPDEMPRMYLYFNCRHILAAREHSRLQFSPSNIKKSIEKMIFT